MTQPKLLNGKIDMGRPRKYDDESHRKLREKVARFRARHKADLQRQYEQRSLTAGRKQLGPQQRWCLYERTEPQGDVGDVIMLRYGDQLPSGYGPSKWLPSMPIAWHLAGTLAAARRWQIREWLTR